MRHVPGFFLGPTGPLKPGGTKLKRGGPSETKSRPAEFSPVVYCKGREPMRSITYALALALGVAFAASAFAADVTAAKTKADCDKAGGVWNATTNTCAAKQ